MQRYCRQRHNSQARCYTALPVYPHLLTDICRRSLCHGPTPCIVHSELCFSLQPTLRDHCCLVMALHATTWPVMRQGSMTALSSDPGKTESASEQRQLSNPNDHEWASFLDSLRHYDQDASSGSNIELGALALDDNLPTHFGAMDNIIPTDPPATTICSTPPVLDSNGAPQQYMNWQQIPTDFSGYDEQAPTPWMPVPQQQQQHLQHFDPNTLFMQDRDGLGIQMAPTSHPIYSPGPLHYDQPFMSQESPLDCSEEYRQDMGVMWNRHEQSVPPQDDLFADDDEAEPEDSADPCYAQLLHRCLKEAPDHTMSLRDLYEWVSQHSQKAKDLKNRGWQNSVRHNLSMNAVSIPLLAPFAIVLTFPGFPTCPTQRNPRPKERQSLAPDRRRFEDGRDLNDTLPQRPKTQVRPPFRNTSS